MKSDECEWHIFVVIVVVINLLNRELVRKVGVEGER